MFQRIEFLFKKKNFNKKSGKQNQGRLVNTKKNPGFSAKNIF